MVTAVAPGRVNLMGDHTDHTGGLVLPAAIDLATTVEGDVGGEVVRLRSAWAGEVAVVALDVEDVRTVEPSWARYVAGVVAELRPARGLTGEIRSTLPTGAGLSSSAALQVAVALALGFEGSPEELAALCQRAEHRAVGVPCGIMDQLASAAGVAGHALRIDCTTRVVVPVPVPEDVEVVVVDSGERRALARSAYAERAAQCQAAEAVVGPLRAATVGDESAIADRVVRRRARHVLTENRRVDELAGALQRSERAALGEIMAESHASLRDDFEVSTPALDAIVAALRATPGVLGARLTGAGWGGCAVALAERGSSIDLPGRAWRVRPSGGARRRTTCGRAAGPS